MSGIRYRGPKGEAGMPGDAGPPGASGYGTKGSVQPSW